MPTIEHEPETISADLDMGAIFGRCPVCGKIAKPHDTFTKIPKPPRVGEVGGCMGCGAICRYIGNGEFVPI